jgi:hypothetical protein
MRFTLRYRLGKPGIRTMIGKSAVAIASTSLRRLLPLLDRADAAQGEPFARPGMLVPHTQSRFYGWTHYGVMIPDLPAPHRFFSIMSIIGTPGALAFDTDHALVDLPRHNATVVSGTAATHPRHFAGYSIPRDCEMREDGSLIRFGKEVEISGGYPNYRVRARYGGFALDMRITATDKVSWFLRNPVYDHLSLLSRYRGALSHAGETVAIEGLCTFEYAACVSPYLLRRRPLPPRFKAPLDFFTYQVINLDDGPQLLLTQYMLLGRPLATVLYARAETEHGRSWRDATFEVLEYQEQPATAPDGRGMRLPQRFRWTARDGASALLDIEGTVDTPFTYGLGSGYVGGYRYSGRYQGRAVAGRGYIEYIDRREG